MKLNVNVILLIAITGIIQSFQNQSYGQISITARYAKGFVNKEIYPRYGTLRINYALAENDIAFGLQIPIVKKWKLFVQAEMEIQKKEYQDQLVNYTNLFLPPGDPTRIPFYDDVYYHVRYTAHHFPLLIKKEFTVLPHLSVSVAAGFLLNYTFARVDSDVLTLYGEEVPDYGYALTKERLIIEALTIKNAAFELKSQNGGTPKIACVGIAYDLYKFKIGAEFRYTSHFIVPDNSQMYSSLNATLAYNLSKKATK